MKPLFLEIQAFGPFVEKQTVDLEKLSSKGIFLIKGETGSGKTTVFDAMTFALYGGGSGTDEKSKVGRNDFEEWRCTQAPDTLDTVVSFVFSSDGKKYRFTRKLIQKKGKLTAEYEAGEIDENGNVIPFFNNPKASGLKAKAEELIGLTKEQFRQVILLPQGQFERFLTASADEKTEILNKIFNAEMWKKYAQKFYETANEKKTALDNEKKAVDTSLAEEKMGSAEELHIKIGELKKKLEECNKAHTEFDGAKKQEKLNEDMKLSERFKPLCELRRSKEILQQQADAIKENEKTLTAAENAEKLRPLIDGFEKAEKDLTTRSNELSKKEKLLPCANEQAEQAEKEIEEHEKNSPVAGLNAKIGEYESKRKYYESFGALEKEYQTAFAEYNTAKTGFDTADKTFLLRKKAAADLLSAYNETAETAKIYRTKYYSGIYGEIAASLTAGEKCPVCGSTEHPCPAEKSPDSVSRSVMEAKEKAADTAKKAWDAAESERKTAEDKRTEKEAALKEKEAAQKDAQAKLNAAKDSLINGIADTKALEDALAALKKGIDEYNDKGRELQQERDNAKKTLEALKAQIETAKQEKEHAGKIFDSARASLEEALKESAYSDTEEVKAMLLDTEKRNELLEMITSYKTKREENEKNLSAKEKELLGITEPDSGKFEDRQKEISSEAENFTKTSTSFKKEIERLSKKYTELSKKLDHYNAQIRSAEEDLAFAKKLRGDSGIGIQRYVLAIMFNQVIGEANEMLKKVHGGRYSLFRSDDKGKGNKRGLELKVHDNRSPEKDGRSVSMLSGGEKFLVSLALSIGMSSVAQRSGVRIEALFIDEGFGTLDDRSIADAMDVLDSVRKTNSMIGIISHVKLLEENISTQLEVIKSESGNSIRAV